MKKYVLTRKLLTIYFSLCIGGHGTNDCIDEYIKLLKDKFNIIVIHQIPRGPETNLLDLGIWLSIQSFVEVLHRGHRTDTNALTKTVMETWEKFNSSVFTKVYQRWQKVLELIVEDNGDNTLVQSKRGKKFQTAAVLPADYTLPANDEDTDEEEEEDELLDGEGR